MPDGTRGTFSLMRVVALAAGVACLLAFAVARPQPVYAATARTKIDALIRDGSRITA